jgi:2-haloacid dehalogenase
MMVAAHNDDLAAARAAGLKTGYVPRPKEHGDRQPVEIGPASDWDVTAEDFFGLAGALGC